MNSEARKNLIYFGRIMTIYHFRKRKKLLYIDCVLHTRVFITKNVNIKTQRLCNSVWNRHRLLGKDSAIGFARRMPQMVKITIELHTTPQSPMAVFSVVFLEMMGSNQYSGHCLVECVKKKKNCEWGWGVIAWVLILIRFFECKRDS